MNITEYKDATQIWMDYQNGLYAYLLKRVKDPELAKELSQQSLQKLYNSCCSGTDIKNTKAWLFRIAHNVMIDHFKASKKIIHNVPELEISETDDVYTEAAEWIGPLINLLPQEYGIPLKMADVDQQKQQDIADYLGLSLPATKSRIQRARKLLKDKIQECCLLELSDKGQLKDFTIREDCEPLTRDIKK